MKLIRWIPLREFSEEAERILRIYLQEVNRKLDELGFRMTKEHRTDFLLSVEHSMRFHAIKHAKKRKARTVSEEDIKKSVRRVTPERLIRHGLHSPSAFLRREKIRERHFKKVKEKFELCERPVVLDAGCGYGRLLMIFTRRGLTGEFVGVDLGRDVLEYAKTVGSAASFVRADLQKALPFRSNVFDIIVCTGVLHEMRHVYGVSEAVGEFSRTLKPEGILYLTDAFVKNRVVAVIAHILSRFVSKIERYYRKELIAHTLEKYGFKNVAIEEYISFFAPLTRNVYICTAIKNG